MLGCPLLYLVRRFDCLLSTAIKICSRKKSPPPAKQKFNLKNLVCLSCLLSLFLIATGAEAGRALVVAPNGDDANIGTVLAPLQSIHKAIQIAEPGDTVFVRNGRYPAGTVIKARGSEHKPIVIRNFPNERPVIDGRGVAGSGLILDNAQHVTVRGFEIRAVGQQHDSLGKAPEWGGILLKDSSKCLIENNILLTGDWGSRPRGWVGAPGIQLWSQSPDKGNSKNRIRGNNGSMGWTGAHVWGPARDNFFEGNYFHQNREVTEDSDGIGQDNSARKFDTITDKVPYNPTRSTIRYNILDGNADDGLDMWVSSNNLVEYNIASLNGIGEHGDGNGYKMGPGGSNTIRQNLAIGNRAKAFSDNKGKANRWSQNLAFDNGSLGESGETNIQADSEEHWMQHELREHILRAIENFQNSLFEKLPPLRPTNLYRRDDMLVWRKADIAADADEATAYLIYLNEELVGIETGTEHIWHSDKRGAISVCTVDNSYKDNQSVCTVLQQ